MTATSQLSYFQQESLFAEACGIHKGNLNEAPNQAAILLAASLINEEVNKELLSVELPKYQYSPSLENLALVADGIADSIYVLCQLAYSLGIPLDSVYAEVQRTNMQKVGADGKVVRREDGKILKPEGWQPPDILKILFEESNKLSVQEGKNGAENWQEKKFEEYAKQQGITAWKGK